MSEKLVVIPIKRNDDGTCADDCSSKNIYRSEVDRDNCPFDLDAAVCRAAEIEVDEDLIRIGQRLKNERQPDGSPTWRAIFAKAYLKFAKAAGK